MSNRAFRLLSVTAVILALSTGIARADVCLSINHDRDTFTETDRAAALMLVAMRFEAESQHVVSKACSETYVLSHVKLGDTITVTLAGPRGQREATAIGMNELPALYSQLVRAVLTGEQVGSMTAVVDRTNVITSQAAPLRVESDPLFYVRLGYGTTARAQAGPAMGMGVRRELDAFAIDVSFFNIQTQGGSGYDTGRGNSSAASWLKLEVLKFKNKTANASAYWGGGASWGGVSASKGNTYWHGSGLQGELTAGYETLRASNIRMFIQTDVALPFYSVTAVTYQRPAASVTERRYMPSATVSVGFGWERGRRARPAIY